jgi:hypothetical protein
MTTTIAPTESQIETAKRYDAFRKDVIEKSLLSLMASSECYQYRNNFVTCRAGNNQIVLSPIIAGFGPALVSQILKKVINFTDFTEKNDPWNEHDMGFFDHSNNKIIWKIDDYQGYQKTELVLTIMLGEEY